MLKVIESELLISGLYGKVSKLNHEIESLRLIERAWVKQTPSTKLQQQQVWVCTCDPSVITTHTNSRQPGIVGFDLFFFLSCLLYFLLSFLLSFLPSFLPSLLPSHLTAQHLSPFLVCAYILICRLRVPFLNWCSSVLELFMSIDILY